MFPILTMEPLQGQFQLLNLLRVLKKDDVFKLGYLPHVALYFLLGAPTYLHRRLWMVPYVKSIAT